MSRLQDIPLDKIRENPIALRAVNKQAESFTELVASVKKEGILNPINVREKDTGDGKQFEIIDGLHRFSAALEAGLSDIPAQILERSDADALATQIIGNIQKVETKPAEYAQQLRRILGINPTMTEAQLATMLAKSPSWIQDQLGLTKLDPKIAKLVDEGRIALSNAFPLSKLPTDQQADWLERAMTMPALEFGPKVQARVKEIRDAARKGKDAAPETFVPVAHLRKKSEIEEQLKNPTAIADVIRKAGVTDPVEAGQVAIAWTLNFDAESKAAQQAKHDAEMARQAEQKERRKAEQKAKKDAEAKAKEAADLKAAAAAKA